MRNSNPLFASICTSWLLLTLATHARAENWAHWRGPFFNGSSADTGLPTRFSKTENVKWAADMPGAAAATPIVWSERIFVSSVDDQKRNLVALCLDRGTGRKIWEQEVAEGYSQDRQSNYASPSPVTDGKLVYFFYGNGDLVAFDFTGKTVWARNIPKDYGQFAFQWTFSTSPTIFENKLYIQVLQRNVPVNGRGRSDGPSDSYLLALDLKTGKELWKHIRPAEAREESLEAFTTPIPFAQQGRKELLIAGGDCISGHDPATGKELWRWGTWNPTRIGHWRLVPSPVAGAGVVLACAPKGSPVYAVKLGGNGTLNDSALAWKSQEREVSSDVSTPLFYKGRFFILNSDRKTLFCVEPAAGKVVWTGQLPSKTKIEASPTAADDKIYVMSHGGEVFVVGTGDEFKLLHSTAMGDEGDNRLRSSIALSEGQLFIRTDRKLYCIGSRSASAAQGISSNR